MKYQTNANGIWTFIVEREEKALKEKYVSVISVRSITVYVLLVGKEHSLVRCCFRGRELS